MIEVKNLSKTYNHIMALNNISFTVRDGEILGFLGPNGAGKTTTMKIITGYTAPTSGEVKVNGVSVMGDSLRIKQQIGYLPESVPLYDDMTVREYLEFVADVRLRKNTLLANEGAGGGNNALRRVIQICGLQKVYRRPIGELSKGYRQRTCLAQALIHNPAHLILDEPTSGLDPNQIAELREVIKEIGKEKTVILSTHILQEVQAMCDRVIIINEGKIVAQGTTGELERQAQGKQVVYTKMKGLKEKIHELLLDLPQVAEVRHRDTEGVNIFGFEIVVEATPLREGFDIREHIFHRAVSAQTPILEMRQESVSLEEVFKQLTR